LKRAEAAGKDPPSPGELSRLKRLAEMESPFSAAQVVRRGWCGVRSAEDAGKTLEEFVAKGWLHLAGPNREGLPRYSFSPEHRLGQTPSIHWPEGIGGREALLAADLLSVGSDGRAKLDCETVAIPTQSAEGDIWAVARKLAYEQGTSLHQIADCIDGLTPIQCAYAMSIAKCRVDGDPVRTHLRGIAEYLSVDYSAFCAGVKVAEAAIRILNESKTETPRGAFAANLATAIPTIEL